MKGSDSLRQAVRQRSQRQEPPPDLIARARQRATRRNLLLLTLLLLALASLAGFAVWARSGPAEWEVRPVKLDGEDIVIATNMRIRKFTVTLPAGMWDLHFKCAGYPDRSTVHSERHGGTFGSLSGGETHTVWLFIPTGPDSDIIVTMAGTSSFIGKPDMMRQPEARNAVSGVRLAGKLTRGVPFVLWVGAWNTKTPQPAVATDPETMLGRNDQTVLLTMMATPARSQSASDAKAPAESDSEDR